MKPFTRREALQAVGTATVVGLAGCQTGSTDDLCGEEPPSTESTIPTEPMESAADLSSDSAWPTYQYDAGQTGFTDDTGPTDSVRLAWSREIGDGATWPVVANGTVVASDSDRGVVQALSPTDGSVEWSVDGFSQTTQLAIVEETVVGGGRTGLYALDLESGTEQWSFTPEDDLSNSDSGRTATKETEVGTVIDDESEETPSEVWSIADFYSAPLYADGTILVKSSLGVHALSPDGTERWRRDRMHLGAVADGTAYLLGEPGMVAVAVESGTEQWTRERTGLGSDMSVSDGTIYGGEMDSLTAIDAETGETEWTFDAESEVFASPTVTPNAVFAGSAPKESEDGGNLYALDRETGEPMWCTYLGFKTVNSPASTGDTVFVTTENVVEARAHDTGDLRWRYGKSDEFVEFQAPAVVDGQLLVGSQEGSVLAFAEE